MRIVLLAALLGGFVLAASGCGNGQHKAAPPSRWVQRANAVCRVADPKIYAGGAIFDSAAMVSGLQREATGLERVGLFRHVPTAGLDVVIAGRRLFRVSGDDFGAQRRIDKLLIDARDIAARKGVHCSFAAFPLQNL